LTQVQAEELEKEIQHKASESLKRVMKENFGNALGFGKLPMPKPSGDWRGISSNDFE
jgi:hypothetical protein